MSGRLTIVLLMQPLALCASLGGCTADAYSSFPAFMRAKAHEAAPPEHPPEVAAIVREQLGSIFLANSAPHNVEVSPAHRNPRAQDWIACVKADVTSATGKPLGSQIYRITIVEDRIVDRARSNDEDNCRSESYEPV
jgi:hypothetical protein